MVGSLGVVEDILRRGMFKQVANAMFGDESNSKAINIAVDLYFMTQPTPCSVTNQIPKLSISLWTCISYKHEQHSKKCNWNMHSSKLQIHIIQINIKLQIHQNEKKTFCAII